MRRLVGHGRVVHAGGALPAGGGGWRRRALISAGGSLALIAVALAATKAFWPAARITTGGATLARIELAPFGEQVSRAAVVLRSGRWTPASVHAGNVAPGDRLAAGSRVTVVVTVRRAGWLGWLLGGSERVEAAVATPAVQLRGRLIQTRRGKPLELAFDGPVAAVSLELAGGARHVVRVEPRSSLVTIGVRASGALQAGTMLVSGVARVWERLPPPVRVNWFPVAPEPEALVRPAPGATLQPSTPLVLTFSRPVSAVLGARRPLVWPRTQGSWSEPNADTLVFQPAGLGFPIGAHVRLGLTRSLSVLSGGEQESVRTLSWQVPPGSLRRLAQLLAELDYLPLSFHPAGAALPHTAAAQAAAAIAAPAGTFSWRHPAPAALKQLWDSAAERPTVLRGALMAFQSVHGMTTSGEPSPALWRVLIAAALDRRSSPYGYSYVFVTETVPETLTLWHNGRVVLTTPVNTGIPGRWTALGTYPVYAHLVSTTMSGTNPNGTHYSDPDVPWVNYFNGGDAVHGFVRASYGFPQSLGCVEAPVPTAAQIFPYVQVGTLVTVVS